MSRFSFPIVPWKGIVGILTIGTVRLSPVASSSCPRPVTAHRARAWNADKRQTATALLDDKDEVGRDAKLQNFSVFIECNLQRMQCEQEEKRRSSSKE